MEVLVTAITQVLGDELLVEGYVDGVRVVIKGWQSAILNHYDEGDYEEIVIVQEGDHESPAVFSTEDGDKRDNVIHGRHLRPGASPRNMTPEEVRAYAERLLLEVYASSGQNDRMTNILDSVPLDPVPESQEEEEVNEPVAESEPEPSFVPEPDEEITPPPVREGQRIA